MTDKLYYIDSHIKSFEATVLSASKNGDKYEIILDKTAFFPEGGGQSADTGYINGIKVFDVQISGDNVVHYTNQPIKSGTSVQCELDWNIRFQRMQNHSGEHILSGILHKMSGGDNVGFHMSDDNTITIDFNVEFSSDELAQAEREANLAVFSNVPIHTYFPSADELKNLSYRSKLDLTNDVRIVDIEGYDICACCAPHVSNTGEIGIIKILSSMRHRGGIRITAVCGLAAYCDYSEKHINNTEISALLSAKPMQTPTAVQNVLTEIQNLKDRIFELKQHIIDIYIDNATPFQNGNICVFCPCLDNDSMRILVNKLTVSNDSICAAFSFDEKRVGYKYVVSSSTVDMSAFVKEMNQFLNGRGGGTPQMVQGSLLCSKYEIENYFSK